jgi:hypothetical protein
VRGWGGRLGSFPSIIEVMLCGARLSWLVAGGSVQCHPCASSLSCSASTKDVARPQGWIGPPSPDLRLPRAAALCPPNGRDDGRLRASMEGSVRALAEAPPSPVRCTANGSRPPCGQTSSATRSASADVRAWEQPLLASVYGPSAVACSTWQARTVGSRLPRLVQMARASDRAWLADRSWPELQLMDLGSSWPTNSSWVWGVWAKAVHNLVVRSTATPSGVVHLLGGADVASLTLTVDTSLPEPAARCSSHWWWRPWTSFSLLKASMQACLLLMCPYALHTFSPSDINPSFSAEASAEREISYHVLCTDRASWEESIVGIWPVPVGLIVPSSPPGMTGKLVGRA